MLLHDTIRTIDGWVKYQPGRLAPALPIAAPKKQL